MSSQRSIPTADRISALPDSVLRHILSFLPTKLAAATSVLSKRWKPVWLSVPALDFDDQTFKDFGCFRLYVYSVLVSRDVKLPIRSFRLKCGNSSPFDAHDVNRIVRAAVQRGIEDLNLDMRFDVLKKLAPSVLSVLSCRTLVVLKLKTFSIYDVPQVDFPLLKTLHLHSIFFLHYGHFKRLLYGCPILENLQTNGLIPMHLGYESEGMFEGLPKLVRANISNSGQTIPFTWVRNAKYLRAGLKWTYECKVPTFHNLTNMELIFESKRWRGKWKWVIEVLGHCPKLQNLIIDEVILMASKDVQVIGDEDWKNPETVPECLSSQLRTCSLRDYKGFKCELQFAEYIMKNSKLLCTMTIESTCSVDGNAKHQMLVKLSSCPRGSETCRLLFD